MTWQGKIKGKHTIYVSCEQSCVRVGWSLLRLMGQAVDAALAFENYRGHAEVSLTFTDNEKIHALNLRYRGVDRATDVLSFPMEEEDTLGDIVISLERAQEQAREYGHSFEREAAFLCVHSVLHLLGYDHERSPEEEADMFDRQEKILLRMGLPRA